METREGRLSTEGVANTYSPAAVKHSRVDLTVIAYRSDNVNKSDLTQFVMAEN